MLELINYYGNVLSHVSFQWVTMFEEYPLSKLIDVCEPFVNNLKVLLVRLAADDIFFFLLNCNRFRYLLFLTLSTKNLSISSTHFRLTHYLPLYYGPLISFSLNGLELSKLNNVILTNLRFNFFFLNWCVFYSVLTFCFRLQCSVFV